MANINLTPEFSLKLINRLQNEYGATSAANFAMDIMLEEANAAIQHLQQALAESQADAAAVRERLIVSEQNNEELKKQLDPSRGDRFAGPKKK